MDYFGFGEHIRVSASKNSAGIIADVLLHYTTPFFEALTVIICVLFLEFS